MTLKGYLSDYSLAEIFQFVEQGQKTGLLSLLPESDASEQQLKAHYLWIHKGRIIAIAEQLDNKGLISMLQQRGWLSSQIHSLVNECFSTEQPLGLYLKAQGAITAEQLKLLFHAQVLRPVCNLFKLADCKFTFEPKSTLPKAEMTGLSLSATEATLLGLRVLRNWTALAQKLPDPMCSLNKATDKPHLQLDSQESQVWKFADGSTSLSMIAKQLLSPVETVQQIAFRLSVVGLVEEAPISSCQNTPPAQSKMPETAVAAANSNSMKVSFLQNLVGFLKTKVA